MRIGQGYDVHRLTEGRKLILGGVEIPYEKGLLGHSDADVLIHAVMDALLGAAALGDIGQHFPDTDPAYKGISSIELLGKVGALLEEKGYVIEKATTEGGLGFTGSGEGIASQAITLLTETADYCYDNKIMTEGCPGCSGCGCEQK